MTVPTKITRSSDLPRVAADDVGDVDRSRRSRRCSLTPHRRWWPVQASSSPPVPSVGMIVRRCTNRRDSNPSSTTASRMSSPSTASRTNSLICGTRPMLWSSRPISTAPKKLPTIVPEPPSVLTPPTTEAAIDSSSSPWPADTVSVPKRASTRNPPRPASAPHAVKAAIVVRRTGRPDLEGGLGVGADGVEDSPGADARQQHLEHEDHDDRHHEHRAELVLADAEHRRSWEVDQPLGQRAGRDRARLGVADQPRAVDRQRAERDDDRGDPPVGDEGAVDEAEQRPDRHGEQHGDDRRCAEVVAEHLPGEVGR